MDNIARYTRNDSPAYKQWERNQQDEYNAHRRDELHRSREGTGWLGLGMVAAVVLAFLGLATLIAAVSALIIYGVWKLLCLVLPERVVDAVEEFVQTAGHAIFSFVMVAAWTILYIGLLLVAVNIVWLFIWTFAMPFVLHNDHSPLWPLMTAPYHAAAKLITIVAAEVVRVLHYFHYAMYTDTSDWHIDEMKIWVPVN